MMRLKNPNIEILIQAVERLGDLADEMVFIGGCATGLLITDEAAPPIRVTKDVDAIVHVVSLVEYYKLSGRLRETGFKEDTSEDAPICRWIAGDILLDVMPSDSSILGFGNQWYQEAIEHAQLIAITSTKQINMVSAPYFLITKLEAFAGRGKGDYLMSHDMEDIIAVLDGRSTIVEEVSQANSHAEKELTRRFSALLKEPRFVDAISSHMPPNEAGQKRTFNILYVIEQLAKLV